MYSPKACAVRSCVNSHKLSSKRCIFQGSWRMGLITHHGLISGLGHEELFNTTIVVSMN